MSNYDEIRETVFMVRDPLHQDYQGFWNEDDAKEVVETNNRKLRTDCWPKEPTLLWSVVKMQFPERYDYRGYRPSWLLS